MLRCERQTWTLCKNMSFVDTSEMMKALVVLFVNQFTHYRMSFLMKLCDNTTASFYLFALFYLFEKKHLPVLLQILHVLL